MRIVDIDVSDLDTVARRGRSRSAEMQTLISAIESLRLGEAKAIELSQSNTAKKIRSRLLYAARVAGKRLEIGEKDDRVIFALDPRPRKRRKSRS